MNKQYKKEQEIIKTLGLTEFFDVSFTTYFKQYKDFRLVISKRNLSGTDEPYFVILENEDYCETDIGRVQSIEDFVSIIQMFDNLNK